MTEPKIKYFMKLYDQIPFPIQIVNYEGRIVYVNHAFTFQWGFGISELDEYSIFNDPVLKDSGAHKAILDTFENGGYKFINNFSDSLLKSKETTIPIFRTKLFQTIIDEKIYVVLFHEDQTEVVLAEEEVKKARDGNKEAERLKDTFLTVLSHELRTPLNIVLGYSSIIKESMKDKINSEDKIYLDNLYSGSERLYNSITQMLEFAQIEAGNYVLNLETIDLNHIIKNCVEENKDKAKEKKLDLKVICLNNNIFVDVDVQSLENAVNNLLNNAIKFTRQGFIEVETSLLEERELAVCRIKDSGVGISTEYLDHLFRPFSQEDLNIGRNFEGNGLGLALAKRYLEKMGGSLLVDSLKGVGSTFTFTLPISQQTFKPMKRNVDNHSESLKNILMFDNSEDTFKLLNAFLKNTYRIFFAALDDFNIHQTVESDAVIFILNVEKNQWERCLTICKEIKGSDPRKRPLIILSNEYLNDKKKQFYSAGADKYIIKPFTKKDFIKNLDELNQ